MTETLPKEITRQELQLLVRRGAQLVEVLPAEAYAELHLAGAVNIPLNLISRKTADRLKWDQPVIAYSQDSQCDLSARAAWRLVSMGFTQVYRYTAGKSDWLAYGLPVEGAAARQPRAGDLADLDVPTCSRQEHVGEVRTRLLKDGGNICVVVNQQFVVLGLLRPNDLTSAPQDWSAEEAMQRDPLTFRLHATLEQVAAALEKDPTVECALVTTPDGKLHGLLRRSQV